MSLSERSSVLLIYTGGTIGMKTDSVSGTLVPFDFNDIYEEFPYVRKLGVDIEAMSLKSIDSSNVTPDLWIKLADIISREYERFDGFVILHGTDTMSYTASALSFMLDNLRKPVVFTGSQIPIGVMRTDGRENLITAIEIAAAKEGGHAIVPEVCLYFQNRLFRANRTTKYSAEELNAFRSDNYPSLADVGVNIQYNYPFISRFENNGAALQASTAIERNVMIVKIFPGITEQVFRSLMDIPDIKGVVLETFGSGNAPTFEWFIKAVTDTVSRGIPIINVTQCHSGKVSMDLYETGVRLREAGVISGYDSTTEAAVTKLMYLLGLGLDEIELNKQIKHSIRGEITV